MRCWLYDWPGNVRELERVIERAVALAESTSIELDDLPPRVRGDYGEVLMPSLAAQRDDARVGQPLRAAGPRALQGNKRETARSSASAITRSAVT